MHGDLCALKVLVDGQSDRLPNGFGAASFLPEDDP